MRDLAPLVATLKDGTVLHMDRDGRVLHSTGPSAHRFLGGPGSGNFGHLGRPGEVGGSASSGAGITNSVPNEQLRDAVSKTGFNTSSVAEIPSELIDAWKQQEPGIDFKDTKTMPEAMIDGVVDGLNAFKGTPIEKDLKDSKIAFLDYNVNASATTARFKDKSIVAINGNRKRITDVFDTSLDDNTVGGRIMAAKGLTGADRLREHAKLMVFHEMGHVIDNRNQGVFSGGLAFELNLRHGGDFNAMEKDLRTISNYARFGPGEAFAEIFAATVAGHDIPAFKFMQDDIRKNLLKKN